MKGVSLKSAAKKKKMKVYTYEKLKKIYKVCIIISAVIAVAMVIFMLLGPTETLGGKTIVNMMITCPIMFFGLFISITECVFMNWKKMIIGIIAPIPMLSGMIECFKAAFYGLKGLVCLFKHQDLAIGHADDDGE